jgi:large subunit ribosomal protein L1
MAKYSKKYKAMLAKLEPGKRYTVAEAVHVLKQMDGAKFDETVEVSMKLGIDPKQADQLVRGSISLPHGLGTSKKVIVFAEGAKAEEARAAGAAEVGGADLAKKIEGGWLDFDVAVASPDMMKVVGRLGRVLGPQGKMPSPKSGTVTENIATAVKEFAAGRVEFRNDTEGNIHVPVGKKSFDEKTLAENIEALIAHISRAKPASSKGVFIEKAVVSLSMSPGVLLAVSGP